LQVTNTKDDSLAHLILDRLAKYPAIRCPQGRAAESQADKMTAVSPS
jgi:hypothetical protein